MADITRLSRLLNGVSRGIDISTNTIVMSSLKLGTTELTKIILDKLLLINSAADVDGTFDTRYTAIAHASDTDNPHAIVLSDVVAGTLVANADVDAAAGIVESKLALDFGTSGLNSAIGLNTTHRGSDGSDHSLVNNHLDGGINKHDETEIDVETVGNYTTVANLQVNLAALDTQIKANADSISTGTDDQTADEVVYTQAVTGDWTAADGSSVKVVLDELGAARTVNEAAISSNAGAASTADGKAVTAQTTVDNHIIDTADAHAASAITNTPAGNIEATTVQAAIDELETEKLSLAGGTLTGDITMGANKITSSAAITSDTQYTTKTYVDSLTSGGFTWIDPLYYVDLVADDYGAGTHIKDYVTPGNSTVDIEHSDMVIVDVAATYRATGSGGTVNTAAVAGDVVRFISDAENGNADPTWENVGHISNTTLFPANSRWGVSTDTDVTPSGTFAGKRGSIYTLTNGAAGGYNASWTLATELTGAGTGVSEAIEMTFPAASTFTTGASVAGDYFLFESDTLEYYAWFNVTDGSNSDPIPYPTYEKTGAQIDVLAADTADQVAAKVQAVLAALTGVSATGATNPVTVTIDASAAVKNALDVNCGVTFANATEGNWDNGPQDTMSFTINNGDSKNFGKQFTYNVNSGRWVLVGATASIVDGIGLKFTGNVLDVLLGAGIKQTPTDEVGIDAAATGGLELTSELTDGQIQIKLDGSTLATTASGAKVNEINNAEIGASAAIAYSKLATLTDGNILIGNGSNVATSVTPSGDITLSNAGEFAIKSDIIVNADVKSDAAIAESKLALEFGTSALNTTIGNHTSNTSNPHAVVLADVVAGTLVANADVDASADIAESKLALDFGTSALNTAIGNHTSDTDNPHAVVLADVVVGTLVANADIDASAGIVTTKLADATELGEAVTFFGATDISGAEAETLTDGSNADSLHNHSSTVKVMVAGESFSADTTYAVRIAVSGETAGRIYKSEFDASASNNFYAIGLITPAAGIVAGDPIAVTLIGEHALGSADISFAAGEIGQAVHIQAAGAWDAVSQITYGVDEASYRIGMVLTTNTIFLNGAQLLGIN